jgi:hypothetical protein
MLWSGDDGLVGVTIADGEQPGTSTLTNNGSGLSVEPAVGHALLDARLTHYVYPVTNFEMLDDGGYRRKPALSQIFLELIPCFLSWTIVMCHV